MRALDRLKKVQQHQDRPSAEQQNIVVDELKRNERTRPMPLPKDVAWVYLFEEVGGILRGKRSMFNEGVWTVYDSVLEGEPAPGYTVADFAPFMIQGEFPTANDRTVLHVGGYFLPPGASGATSFIAGKIIAVNRIRQQAILAPPLVTTDPSNDFKWGDDVNFDMNGGAVCCWMMGHSVVQVGWAGIAFRTGAWGNWLLSHINLIGDDEFSTFCEPEGSAFSPSVPFDCPVLSPDPAVCDTVACYTVESGHCEDVFDYQPCVATGNETIIKLPCKCANVELDEDENPICVP